MVDNDVENEALAAKQPEIDSLLAQKDAAETRVLTLEAEKLAVDKPRRLKLPDVDQWNGKPPLGPFLSSCDEFLRNVAEEDNLSWTSTYPVKGSSVTCCMGSTLGFPCAHGLWNGSNARQAWPHKADTMCIKLSKESDI